MHNTLGWDVACHQHVYDLIYSAIICGMTHLLLYSNAFHTHARTHINSTRQKLLFQAHCALAQNTKPYNQPISDQRHQYQDLATAQSKEIENPWSWTCRKLKKEKIGSKCIMYSVDDTRYSIPYAHAIEVIYTHAVYGLRKFVRVSLLVFSSSFVAYVGRKHRGHI